MEVEYCKALVLDEIRKNITWKYLKIHTINPKSNNYKKKLQLINQTKQTKKLPWNYKYYWINLEEMNKRRKGEQGTDGTYK